MPPPAAEPTLTFLGTATCLLRLGPFTLLTDPNFLHRGQRAYLGKGLWSRRLTEPALGPAELPELDAVVLSHLHGDHFDRVARRTLDRELPLLTTPQASRRLSRWGFRGTHGLSTWETVELERDGTTLRLTAVPGQHAPGPVRHALPPVMGTVLELRRPDRSLHRLYISGDTLHRPWLRSITDRLGPLDAAVLHLGGTRILGVTVTMDDRQGSDLVDLLDPPLVVPVHHDDYGVFKSPVTDFYARTRERGTFDRVRPVGRGETVSLYPSG